MTTDDETRERQPRRVWPWLLAGLVVILFGWFLSQPITFECDPNDDHLGACD